MKKIFLFALVILAPQFAFAGSQTYSFPGTYTFYVPAYGTLTAQVWGGGGAGGGFYGVGGLGGASYFGSSIAASGGAGGAGGSRSDDPWPRPGGAGGIGYSGTTNITGGSGLSGSPGVSYSPYVVGCPGPSGAGGAGAAGGAGGAAVSWTATGNAGAAPGGGGSGGAGATMYSWPEGGGNYYECVTSGGGGGGGYAAKSYSAGQFTPGTPVTVIVGAGGVPYDGWRPYNGAGGYGATGRVTITWTEPVTPSCSISVSPSTISQGSGATLSWSATNASTFYISYVGYVNTTGSTWVAPSSSTTYTGTVSGPGGTATCTRTLTVNQSCALPWGGSVAHGSSATAYQSATVPYGNSCASQTRTCSNGSLSGSYAYGSCSASSAASCTLNGITVPHGSSRTFYSSQISPIGTICSAVSQTRTCTNGTLSGSATYQYGSCSCAPIYSCSGNNVQYTNSSCVTSTVAACTAPSSCSAGQSTCVNPEPTFNETGDHSGHLEVRPRLVRAGDTTKVYWNVSTVQSCSVTGTNGNSWTGLTSGGAGQVTSPITERTTFTLTCLALAGAAEPSFSESATVLTIPVFQEQ